MNKTYDEFDIMMSDVASDIVHNDYNQREIIYITCSGGMDSISVVLALHQYTNNLHILHWNQGRGRYDDTLTKTITYFCEQKKIPVTIVKFKDQDVIRMIHDQGYKKFIFSDGFDIAFSEIYTRYPVRDSDSPYGEGYNFSYGEWFRSRHNLLDIIAHLPDRFDCWKHSQDVSGYERLMSDIYLDPKYRDREGLNVDVIDFDGHPLFVDFFWEWYTPLSNIFWRKQYVERYIKEHLGMSHRDLIWEATREKTMTEEGIPL